MEKYSVYIDDNSVIWGHTEDEIIATEIETETDLTITVVDGVPLYKYVDGVVVERTAEEKETDKSNKPITIGTVADVADNAFITAEYNSALIEILMEV